MRTLNVRRIIHALGGPKQLAEEHRKLAATYGYKPLPLNTINGWSSKNYIRWERLPEIYHVAAVTGVDLDIRRFIIEKVT